MAKRRPSAAYRKWAEAKKVMRGQAALAKYYESVQHVKGQLVATDEGVGFVPDTDPKKTED